MKSVFFIFLLTLFVTPSKAQVSIKAKSFLNEVITEKNINYLDSGGVEAARIMNDALKNGSVFYRFEHDLTVPNSSREKSNVPKDKLKKTSYGWMILDSIVLSDKEKAHIGAEIKRVTAHKWLDNLFPNAKTIPADSIANFSKEYLRWIAAKGYQLPIQTKEKILSWHAFSYPVFLRGDTYCLFYSSDNYISIRGSGEGSGTLSVYKKEKGKWLYWCCITRWVT